MRRDHNERWRTYPAEERMERELSRWLEAGGSVDRLDPSEYLGELLEYHQADHEDVERQREELEAERMRTRHARTDL